MLMWGHLRVVTSVRWICGGWGANHNVYNTYTYAGDLIAVDDLHVDSSYGDGVGGGGATRLDSEAACHS